eukprot:4956-Heterococcus_DN1.PRE.4
MFRLIVQVVLGLGAVAAFSQASIVLDRKVDMTPAKFVRYVSSPDHNKRFLESMGDHVVEVSAWVQQSGEGWWPAASSLVKASYSSNLLGLALHFATRV